MKRALVGCLLALVLSSVWAQPVYKFGVVPQFDPRRLSAVWTPILSELEKRTGFRLQLVGPARIVDFEREFEEGQYDFAYMNPYHSLVAMRSHKFLPLVRDGAGPLYGILVVAKDGPIRTVADLDGKTVAFPAPNSLGASLLLRADLDRLFKIKVTPLWAQTHTSAYMNVALGRADAAGGVMATFSREPEAVRSKLTVLYETRRTTPHPVMAHPRVPAADRDKLRQAFLDLGATPAGAALLGKVPINRVVVATEGDYRELTAWDLDEYYVKEPD